MIMFNVKLSISFIFAVISLVSSHPALWSELGIDPETRQPFFKSSSNEPEDICDTGNNQSPIDISQCVGNGSSTAIHYQGHADLRPEGFTLMHTGDTAQVTFNGAPATLSQGPLSGEYTFQQMHFHWGARDTLGSEHAVSGHFGSLECHLVHFKSEYLNMSEALEHPDGVTVVGLLFDLVPEPNEGISEIIDSLEKIQTAQSSVKLSPLAMTWFAEFATFYRYYTYSGSLTTPPCAEVVTWVIPQLHATISPEQLAKFRQLLEPDGSTPILEFRRPVQSINDRSIFCTKLEHEIN